MKVHKKKTSIKAVDRASKICQR